MIQFILFEDSAAFTLMPLTLTRHVADLLIGMDSLYAKWAHFLGHKPLLYSGRKIVFNQLQFQKIDDSRSLLFINASFVPDQNIAEYLTTSLPIHSCVLTDNGKLVAFHLDTLPESFFPKAIEFSTLETFGISKSIIWNKDLLKIEKLPQLFRINGILLRSDYKRLTAGKQSELLLDSHTKVYGLENIFIEQGVKIKAATLNAETGPIYIASGAEIQEGAIIHGAHFIGANTVIGMGAILKGDSSFGTQCRIGGEVSNSIILGYSNKAHDGFLGNSVIGAWCNLGAGTTVSNLKNNYSHIKLYSYFTNDFEDSGGIFCGLMMGDHSKTGINTSFNTGTVVGAFANVFDAGFPPKFIPSFAWGGANGFQTWRLDDALLTATKMMERRKHQLTQEEESVYRAIFEELI